MNDIMLSNVANMSGSLLDFGQICSLAVMRNLKPNSGVNYIYFKHQGAAVGVCTKGINI